MGKPWKFNPTRRGRVVQSFDEFASMPHMADALNLIDSTYFGMDIISRVRDEGRVGFSVEPLGDNYGQYIPAKRNLRAKDNPVFADLDGLITIDKKEMDKIILPFILAHEGFHYVQDRQEYSGLVPMYTNGVYYNPHYTLKDEAHFTRAFKTMERAADVIAMVCLWDSSRKGNSVPIWGEFLGNTVLGDVARCIQDAGEWAIDQPNFRKSEVLDTCMFWGNMAGLWSERYNEYLNKGAKAAFKSTSGNVTYSTAPKLPTSDSNIEFTHFLLISDSFGKRQWNVAEQLASIEQHATRRKQKMIDGKIDAVRTAIATVEERRLSGAALGHVRPGF